MKRKLFRYYIFDVHYDEFSKIPYNDIVFCKVLYF